MTDIFNWRDLHAEVVAESRGRVALVSLPDVGKGRLYNALMGWPVLDGRQNQANLGAFRLVDLPVAEEPQGLGPELLLDLAESDLILMVLAARHQLRAPEYAWFSQLRNSGTPVMVLLLADGVSDAQVASQMSELETQLGTPVMSLSLSQAHLADRVCRRMFALCPDLAIPLGQHFGNVRRTAANRVIWQTAMLNAVVGLEPVPLLDAPLQLASQGGMVLRIGAIYGHPTGRGWPPELLGSVLVGVLLRLAAQQAVKLVPVAGWAMGGGVALAGTWLLGQAAVAYFEADRGQQWWQTAQQRGVSIRDRQTRLAARVKNVWQEWRGRRRENQRRRLKKRLDAIQEVCLPLVYDQTTDQAAPVAQGNGRASQS